MKAFAVAAAVSLSAVAALNYVVDPTHRWRQKSFSLEGKASGGRLFAFPRQWDDRLLRLEHIRSSSRPDVLLLGSSRVMAVDSSMFSGDIKVYVAGLVGATVQDYAAVWEFMRSRGQTPRYLIFYADPWMINAHSGQFRWYSLVGLYRGFLVRSGILEGQEMVKVMRLSWERFYTSFAELLNLEILSQSLKKLWSRGKENEILSPVFLDAETVPPDDADAWYPDGHIFLKSLPPVRLEEIRAVANEYASARPIFSLFRYSADPVLMAVLEAMINEAHRLGVKVLFILPPYHKAALHKIAQRPDYREAIPRFRAALESLSRSGRRFPVCDAIDPEVSGCGETEFQDAMHARPSCHRKVLARCLEPLADWREIFPKKNGIGR